MASSSKQLWELLQEQQEPAMADIYVSERSTALNNHPSRRLSRFKLNRQIFQTKKILKLILYKLICHKPRQQIFSRISNSTGKLHQIGASKRCLRIGSSVSYNDASNGCMKDSHCYENSSIIEQKVDTNIEEDNEQLTSRSLLNEGTSSNLGGFRFLASEDKQEEKDASASSRTNSKYPDEDTILTTFLWELQVKTLLEKQNQSGIDAREMTGPGFSELLKNRRVLQQSKQLVFDCINEAIEIERERKSQNHSGQLVSLQELGSIIYDENQNSTQKINFDVGIVVKSWDDMQHLHRKIGIEIGDNIMDEITQEVISSLLQSLLN